MWFGVFCRISPDILDRFSQSFHHMKALYVRICTFFSKFGELPSSNLGVYAVKTRNFCRHAPAILGRSSYVTLAFRNRLEDRNFDFSGVIGKHFCTPYRNLVRFATASHHTPHCHSPGVAIVTRRLRIDVHNNNHDDDDDDNNDNAWQRGPLFSHRIGPIMLKLHLIDLLSICYTANFATHTVASRTDGA